MAKESPILLPKHRRILSSLGENIKLARKRRKLTTSQVAERSGIARSTLYLIESGSPGATIGNLLRVLSVLGLEGELSNVAGDDEFGRKLADAELLGRKQNE